MALPGGLGAAFLSGSWRTPRRCRPRPGSARSAARNGTAWCGWPWESCAGRCPRCPNWRTRRWEAVTAGPYRWACDAARQVENFTDFGGISLGSIRDCWAIRTAPGRPATRSAPRGMYCTTRSSGRRPPTPRPPPGVRQRAGLPRRSGAARYRLHSPYTIALRLGWGAESGPDGLRLLVLPAPLGRPLCRGHVVIWAERRTSGSPPRSSGSSRTRSSARTSGLSSRSAPSGRPSTSQRNCT